MSPGSSLISNLDVVLAEPIRPRVRQGKFSQRRPVGLSVVDHCQAASLCGVTFNTEGWSILIGAIISAVIGMVLLAVAVITGSTVIALFAIAIAIVGLLLMARDWRNERRARETEDSTDWPADERQPQRAPKTDEINAEMFEPDVSYEEAIESADDTEDFDLEGDGTSDNEK